MIKSMTAFGRAKIEGEAFDVTVEMRSVNSRFLDPNIKLPRAYIFLEDRLRTYIQTNMTSRGKVDLFITVDHHGNAEGAPVVDVEYTRAYLEALTTLRDTFGLRDDISVMSLSRNPEVFVTKKKEEDLEEVYATILPALTLACEGYSAMRVAEGRRIENDLLEKLSHMKELVCEVERISHEDTVGYREKLETRIRAILDEHEVTVDENRLLTECAIWQDKIAIDEEIVRLRSHFDAFYEIAALPEPSGRKLDFLMQEMNRETNTIGSKANNARIARIVVDMKGELEKMREQIQNIE
ncbi:MAG: YicC family protein [Clostridia bacterium]|nr:YicC family protein [Clostridia bacterium]